MIETPSKAQAGQPSPSRAGAPAILETRLSELADVTRQYAFFGRLGVGLGILPAALCLFVASWAAWREHADATAILLSLAPPTVVVTSAFTRRWYQRHGFADSPMPLLRESRPTLSQVAGWIGWALLALWLVATTLGFGSTLGRPRVASHALYSGFACATATTALLLWKRPRRGDGSWWWIVWLGWQLTTRPLGPIELVIYGSVMAAIGAVTHFAYRKVELRLLAIRVSG